MRLIDADKLIEDIYLNSYACTNDEVNEILNKQLETNIYVINNQPTAFDVDKVVEKLEKLKDIHFVRFDSYMKQGQKELAHKHLLKVNAYHKALEKVKAGGIDEDR